MGADFRDQKIAAPLKPHDNVSLSCVSTYFRDQKIAAPLKQEPPGVSAVTGRDFRDQKIAAPLKLLARLFSDRGELISAIRRSRPH